MAFYNWVDQINISSGIQTEEVFSVSSDRTQGFSSGTEAIAKNVNSGLRQANLVACALMDSLDITNLSLESSREDVTSAITNKLNNYLNYISTENLSQTKATIEPATGYNPSLGSQGHNFQNLYVNTIYLSGTNFGQYVQTQKNRIDDLEEYEIYNTTANEWSSGRAKFMRRGKTVTCSFYVVATLNNDNNTLIPYNIFNAHSSFTPNSSVNIRQIIGNIYNLNGTLIGTCDYSSVLGIYFSQPWEGGQASPGLSTYSGTLTWSV